MSDLQTSSSVPGPPGPTGATGPPGPLPALAASVMFDGNSTSTTATAGYVMLGFGNSAYPTPWTFTPRVTGKVVVFLKGFTTTAIGSLGGAVGLNSGAGAPAAAPVYGAAAVGNVSSPVSFISAAVASVVGAWPFALGVLLSLTPGTQYWFDLELLSFGGQVSVQNVQIVIQELYA